MALPEEKEQHPGCTEYDDASLASILGGSFDPRCADELAAHIELCQSCSDRVNAILASQIGPAAVSLPHDSSVDSLADAFAARIRIPPPTVDDFLPNDRIGPYHVIERIGKGGSGVVYECLDPTLGRRVAVKVLKHPAYDPSRLARQEREARLQASLDHPAIVRAFEVKPFEFPPYIVMELVPGGPSSQLVEEGPITPRAAARLVAAVAHALQHAHDHGVLHRDIKPSNLLIAEPFDPEGTNPRTLTLKISDFDLARPMTGDSSLTSTQNIVGTPAYMSPEQARGRHDELGPASDIYSLGVVLYEFLVGRPPLVADNPVNTLQLITSAFPVSPRSIQPGISRDLDTICMKCLRKNPAERYASASQLARDLERYLDGLPIMARPIGRLNRLWRWSRRNRGVAASLAFSLLLLVVLAASSLRFAIVQNHLREQAQNNADLFRNAADRAVLAERKASEESDFTRNLFFAGIRNLDQLLIEVDKIRDIDELPGILAKAKVANRDMIRNYAERPRLVGQLDPDALVTLFRDATSFHSLGYRENCREILEFLIDNSIGLPGGHPDFTAARNVAIKSSTFMAVDSMLSGKPDEAVDQLENFRARSGIDFERTDLSVDDLRLRRDWLKAALEGCEKSGQTKKAEAYRKSWQRIADVVWAQVNQGLAENDTDTTP